MASSLRSHLGFLTVTGVGLFSDGYLNITIGLIVPMLGYIYFQEEKNKVPTFSSDVIKGSLPLGMIVGQLLFGVIGDALGRHIVYGKDSSSPYSALSWSSSYHGMVSLITA
jgi:PHS family inorganic phosphate transporter-like MFS transporter